MRYTRLIFIQLILIFGIINFLGENTSLGSIPTNDNISPSLLNYGNLTVIEPILASTNAEIDLYAQNNNLTGNGTKDFPYVIDSVLINASTVNYAVSLNQIDRYVTIRSSYMLGGLIYSIYTKEVANLYLFNNTIDRSQISTRYECCENEGIFLQMSANITVEQNLIWDTRVGISTQTSFSSTFLSYFGNHNFINNTIHNVHNGIVIADLGQYTSIHRGNTIRNNFVSDAFSNGIYLQGSAHGNNVFGNKLINASGLFVFSDNNTVTYNSVSEDTTGIGMNYGAKNNNIFNNTLSVRFTSLQILDSPPIVSNNSFRFNNFISTSKVVDYIPTEYINTFDKNFYSDHNLTDSDNNGFTDLNYTIVSGNILDINPLASVNLDSFASLNLTFRPYPNYTEPTATITSTSTSSSTTTSSSTMVTPIETVSTISSTTETGLPTTSTPPDLVTITIIESSPDTKDDNQTSVTLGSPYLIAIVMSSLFTLFKLKKRIKS